MSQGPRPYLQHGSRHGPRGSDPSNTDNWIYVAAAATAWSSGTTYSPGDIVSHDVFNYIAMVTSIAIQPQVTSGWSGFWAYYQPLFQNSWVNDTSVDDPVAMRFRLAVGGPNQVNFDGVSIDVYTPHQIDLEGDITGGAAGTVVCTLPPEFRREFGVPLHAHDDNGFYVAGRLYANGNIKMDVP